MIWEGGEVSAESWWPYLTPMIIVGLEYTVQTAKPWRR